MGVSGVCVQVGALSLCETVWCYKPRWRGCGPWADIRHMPYRLSDTMAWPSSGTQLVASLDSEVKVGAVVDY